MKSLNYEINEQIIEINYKIIDNTHKYKLDSDYSDVFKPFDKLILVIYYTITDVIK